MVVISYMLMCVYNIKKRFNIPGVIIGYADLTGVSLMWSNNVSNNRTTGDNALLINLWTPCVCEARSPVSRIKHIYRVNIACPIVAIFDQEEKARAYIFTGSEDL